MKKVILLLCMGVLFSLIFVIGTTTAFGASQINSTDEASVVKPIARYTFSDSMNPGKDTEGNFDLVEWGDPKVGNDGTSDYLELDRNSALVFETVDSRDFTDVFPTLTITVWAQRDELHASLYDFIVGTGVAYTTTGFGMGYFYGNHAFIVPMGNIEGGGYSANYRTSSSDGFGPYAETGSYATSLDWNFFALRIASPTDIQYMINGYLYDLDVKGSQAILENLEQTFTIGGVMFNNMNKDGFANGMDGKIADLRVYAGALSDEALGDIFSGGRAGGDVKDEGLLIKSVQEPEPIMAAGKTEQDVFAAVRGKTVNGVYSNGESGALNVFWKSVDLTNAGYAVVHGVVASDLAMNGNSFQVEQIVNYGDTICADSIFMDNMVLQRGNARIYGRGGTIGGRVRISYNGTVTESEIDSEDGWVVRLPLTQAVSEGKTLTIEYQQAGGGTWSVVDSFLNIRVGEVWLCSGQSNMAITLDYIAQKDASVLSEYSAAKNWSQLSVYQVPYRSSSEPQAEIVEGSEWIIPRSVTDINTVSAFAAAFGVQLQKVLGVPVGIVVSSVGGSCIEEWIDSETMQQLPSSADAMGKTDSNLYNGMIHPLIGFGIGGLLWYQGEANVQTPEMYRTQFKVYVERYRELFEAPMLPILSIQLPQYCDWTPWYGFREMQWNLQSEVEGLFVVCGIDLGDNTSPHETANSNDCIHPTDKWPFAARAVGVAAAKVYGIGKDAMTEGIPWGLSPAIVSAEMTEEGVLLKANAELLAQDDSVDGFEVKYGGWWSTVDAVIVDGDIFIRTSVKPDAVRYLQANVFADGHSFARDVQGLPLAPFGEIPVGVRICTVSVSSGKYGSVIYDGASTVTDGTEISVAIRPDEGYEAQVYVNGVRIAYTGELFNYIVTEDIQVSVEFVPITPSFIVHLKIESEEGSISSAEYSVKQGDMILIAVQPMADYRAVVTIGGKECQVANNVIRLDSVTQDFTVEIRYIRVSDGEPGEITGTLQNPSSSDYTIIIICGSVAGVAIVASLIATIVIMHKRKK